MANKAGPWQQPVIDTARVKDPAAQQTIRALEAQIRALVARVTDLERRVTALEP